MKNLGYFVIALLLVSCGSDQNLEISSNEIDQYVTEKTDPSQEYDVSQSLRFSRENETYEVVRYMQNDSVILYLETEVTADEQVVRQIFYKHELPIYVDEYIASNVNEKPFTQRKIYLDGEHVISAFARSSDSESELEFLEYEEADVEDEELDFKRPRNAMKQEGEFELAFEEFITIDQTYLILENAESKYDVALFVNGPHAELDKIYADPAAHKGRPFFVTHQFVLMNGIERTLFIDGYFTDQLKGL